MNNQEKRNTNMKSVGFAKKLIININQFLKKSLLRPCKKLKVLLKKNKWVDDRIYKS